MARAVRDGRSVPLLPGPMLAFQARPGRYEVETEMVVRAARLGFRFAEVEIPTVYGEEKSQIRTMRDVPRIVGTMARLTVERVAPPACMREAARRRAAGEPAA